MDELLEPGPTVAEPGRQNPAASTDLIKRYRAALRRRWRLIVAVALVSAAAFTAYAMSQTTVYTAQTLLLIERQPNNVIDVEEVIAETTQGSRDFYSTQFEMLRSRSLIAEVIKTLELPLSVDTYSRRLSVSPVPNSRLAEVSFTASDPQLAARIANGHSQEFINSGLERRTQATDRATSFLDVTLSDLTMRLEESEAVLGKFRHERQRFFSLDQDNELSLQRLQAQEELLIQATAKRIMLEIQVQTMREKGPAKLPSIVNSDRVHQMQDELAALVGRNRDEWVPNDSLEARIAEVQRRLDDEMATAGRSLEEDLRGVAAHEQRLRDECDKERQLALRSKDLQVEYAMLEREAETNRQLYESVLQRKKELSAAAAVRMSNVFVIDEAFPPKQPSGRPVPVMIAAGVLLSILVGVGAALGLETLDNSVKMPSDVEWDLGLICLGTIPRFKGVRVPRKASGSRAIPARSGPFLLDRRLDLLSAPEARPVIEAHRGIRTNILLSQAGEPPRTLLFTSAEQGEGKTITALNSAVSLAQLGAPVLIIDADLRRPRCNRVLGVERSAGLTEVLAGICEPNEVIQKLAPHFEFMDGGAQEPPDPVELLGSSRMRTVLASLREQYSFIVIDAPPLLPVSDALALSPLVDGVVLVIGRGVSKPAVARARAKLDFARSSPIGAILNGFDLRDTGEFYVYESHDAARG